MKKLIMFLTKIKPLDLVPTFSLINDERINLSYEIYQKDECYYIKVLLPDIKKENISLKVEEGYLTISALRIAPEQTSLYSNINYGELYNRISLYKFGNIKIESCSSTFKEGVLLIKLGKCLDNQFHININ